MVVESIMCIGIGFLFAGLIALFLMPLIHGRAERLTIRRLEACLPRSMAEIQADKDLLRATFAVSTRRLEIINDQLRTKVATQLAELGRKQDAINRLTIQRDEMSLEIMALKAKSEKSARSIEATEQLTEVPVVPTTEIPIQEVLWAREMNGDQSLLQADTWSRDHLTCTRSNNNNNDEDIAATSYSTQEDTWIREDSENTAVVPTVPRSEPEPLHDSIGAQLTMPIATQLFDEDTWEREQDGLPEPGAAQQPGATWSADVSEILAFDARHSSSHSAQVGALAGASV